MMPLLDGSLFDQVRNRFSGRFSAAARGGIFSTPVGLTFRDSMMARFSSVQRILAQPPVEEFKDSRRAFAASVAQSERESVWAPGNSAIDLRSAEGQALAAAPPVGGWAGSATDSAFRSNFLPIDANAKRARLTPAMQESFHSPECDVDGLSFV